MRIRSGQEHKIKQERMTWVGYGRRVTRTQFWFDNLAERDYLGYVGVAEIIILKWMLKEYDVSTWTGFI